MRSSTAARVSASTMSARSRYSSRPSAQGGANRSASWAGVGRALSRMRASGDEPPSIAADSLLKMYSRLESQLAPSPADVSHQRPWIALRVILDDLGFAARNLADGACQLVDTGRHARRDIVRAG